MPYTGVMRSVYGSKSQPMDSPRKFSTPITPEILVPSPVEKCEDTASWRIAVQEGMLPRRAALLDDEEAD